MSDFNQRIIEQFRDNGGDVQGFGRGLVLLHNTGAKSGTEYVNPVAAIPDGDAWFITASAAGSDKNPAWYHNLKANPDAEIETPDDGTVAVRAEELPRAERDAAYARFAAMSDGFAGYEKKTDRVIPVLRLTRR